MKILSISTSSNICSVAILDDKKVILCKNIDDKNTHSEKLMPLIDSTLNECNLHLKDINLLACSVGPGSFTGIRIGIATLKAFYDATSIPVVGITSLEGLAYNVHQNGFICSLIDAKHNNVYCSVFKLENNTYTLQDKYISDNIENILPMLKKYNDKITFVGDGSIVYKSIIENYLSNSACFVCENLNKESAISIGLSALDKYNSGYVGTSSTLSPIYLKKSQAERLMDVKKNELNN